MQQGHFDTKACFIESHSGYSQSVSKVSTTARTTRISKGIKFVMILSKLKGKSLSDFLSTFYYGSFRVVHSSFLNVKLSNKHAFIVTI